MEIEVTDGLNIVSVGLSDIGSYFRHKLPITISWADCGGSVARYMSMMPYDSALRAELQQKILTNLYTDYTGKENDLYQVLKPLFRLFINGKYHLSFSNNLNPYFLQYQTSTDNFSETHTRGWYVSAPKMVRFADEEKVKNEHKKFLKTLDRKKCYPSNLIDYTTDLSYDPSSFVLYATRPQEDLDAERVAFFEKEIQDGRRPFAITINSNYAEGDLDSEEFILDGHHKLAAYQKLGIPPPLARITFLAERDTLGFDAELLIDRLFSWQVAHIIENWDDKLHFMNEALKNPDSKLHRFIKNGLIKEKHGNGKPKHEAFYVDDRVEGISRGWFDNGKKQYEHHFKNGRRIGSWTDWHPNGQVSFVQRFNDEGGYDHERVSYYENGNIRGKTVFDDGRNADGKSSESFYENGIRESEMTFKDNQLLERINYDRYGNITNHERYNQRSGKMVKLTVTPTYHYPEKYDKISKENISHIYQKYDPYEDSNGGGGRTYTWKYIIYLIMFILWLLGMMSL